MRVSVFSAKPYDRKSFDAINGEFGHDLHYFENRLRPETVPLARDSGAVCVFVNDIVNADVLQALHDLGVGIVALRCAGFNNVDVEAAHRLDMRVGRVPAYSPYAVAEHAMGLILALNRRLPRAYNRVRDGNLSLEGLLGFDLHGKTAGVVGTGKIGAVMVRILAGFGCSILAFDPYPNAEVEALGARYVGWGELIGQSDIITLHCPLNPESHHLIDAAAVEQMRDGVMLINTSRGALVDTAAVIGGLKSGHIGYLGLDVYEEEGDLFFRDLSSKVIQDDTFARLLTFPNVLITGHQGFFTSNALENIARVTLGNISQFESEGRCDHCVGPELVKS